MPGVPSLQPQWCDECGQPKMAWVVSATDTNKEQNANKDIDSQTGSADVLYGTKIESDTEKAESKSLEKSEGGLDPFYLCTDPTCKGHTSTLGKIVRWKLRHASDQEYSKQETREIVKDTVKQSMRDYQTVLETVEKITDTKTPQNTEVEETPPQQLGRCECGEQQNPTQRSVGETATEQESVTNTTRMTRSIKASISALPLIDVEAGGKTQSGDGTTNTEISTFNTIDTGTFPICPDLSCEEHLKMIGMIESWKMRNSSTREYSDKEVDGRLTNVIEQEKSDGEIITEAVENVREEMFGNELDQETGIEDSDSLTDSGERSADTEATAASAVTGPLYDQLNAIESAEDSDTFEHDLLSDEIAAIGSEYTRVEGYVTRFEEETDTQTESIVKQQRLIDRLETMDPQDEASADKIDTLTESITTFDPETPGSDDLLNTFAEQVDEVEQNNDVHTDQSEATAGSTELQELDVRLDAIDSEDEKVIQRRDSLKEKVEELDHRRDQTSEEIAELDPDRVTNTEQTATTTSEESPASTETEATEDTNQSTQSEEQAEGDVDDQADRRAGTTPESVADSNKTNDADTSGSDDDSPTDGGGNDSEGEEATETTTTDRNTDGTPESDGGPPDDGGGSDDRGGDPETDTESTGVDPGAEPAEAN